MFTRLASALLFTLVAFAGVHAQTLVVESVVSPAWIERGSAREPLQPGVVLRGKDKVHTGAAARVLLRMAEGSAVKLGENATLAVDELLERKGPGGQPAVNAVLEMARGAFRFTTAVFGKQRGERDVRVRISAVTAGIRGTDVWGKSEPERDIVCLVDGRVTVEHGAQQYTMQEPLSFFIAPRNANPLPIAPVPKELLNQWVQETEIRAGSGATRARARHAVEVLATRDHNLAEQGRVKLRTAGFPAEIETLRDSYGNEEYRLHSGGLAEPRDAQSLAARLKAEGFGAARVAR
ncbi:MAG: FecR domain-containing protein [Betaproteobacteria bacterium]